MPPRDQSHDQYLPTNYLQHQQNIFSSMLTEVKKAIHEPLKSLEEEVKGLKSEVNELQGKVDIQKGEGNKKKVSSRLPKSLTVSVSVLHLIY